MRLGEPDLSPDGGDPDAVAVAPDPGDHPCEEPPVPLFGERTEQERIEQRHGPGAHRHDVAHDPTHTRRRALVRLDRARMRVRLDLEHDGDPVADVDRTGVLARPDEHCRTFGRQRAEVDLRGFVRTVLGPHHRVHRELGSVRLPTEGRLDLRQLVVGEPELPVERSFLRTHPVTPAIAACSSDAKSGWPPVGPTSGSTACSGCGISPTTLPAGLLMPATLFVAPFGF